SEREIRSKALDDIFGKIKKSGIGNRNTSSTGLGDEVLPELRSYNFGDRIEQIDFASSIKNAQQRGLGKDFILREEDLEVRETSHQSQLATVMMIDISHSMILYGEDRITPAKKVALALAEFIGRVYPKDSLDIVVFGNDAWQVQLKDLPYLQVGPFHTNTVAGLELAMEILRKKKTANRQIFMITDGKPTCLKEGDHYYKNSMGHDPKIISKCINLAVKARKSRIPITTFMIANDPYLEQFVEEFTQANKGRAFYSGLNGLGDMVFADYEKNKRRNTRF
ncbi:MAG: vWA domain-containing protein, partial [Luteibaculum sp.]